MRKRVSCLKTFHWQLQFSLCAIAPVPVAYQMIKPLLLSSASEPSVFDILRQMEWLELIPN